MATRVQLVERVDDHRVIGKPAMLKELHEKLSYQLPPIVLPAFKRSIRRELGKTQEAHKYTNRREVRTPLPRGKGKNQEAHGSELEKRAFVAVTKRAASGQGAGRGGRGAVYGLEVGSSGKTHDGRLFTLPLLIGGRKGKGVIEKRVSFWGRYDTDNGPVRVRRFRHVAIKEKPDVLTNTRTKYVMTRVRNRFAKTVIEMLGKDAFKSYFVRFKVQVTK